MVAAIGKNQSVPQTMGSTCQNAVPPPPSPAKDSLSSALQKQTIPFLFSCIKSLFFGTLRICKWLLSQKKPIPSPKEVAKPKPLPSPQQYLSSPGAFIEGFDEDPHHCLNVLLDRLLHKPERAKRFLVAFVEDRKANPQNYPKYSEEKFERQAMVDMLNEIFRSIVYTKEMRETEERYTQGIGDSDIKECELIIIDQAGQKDKADQRNLGVLKVRNNYNELEDAIIKLIIKNTDFSDLDLKGETLFTDKVVNVHGISKGKSRISLGLFLEKLYLKRCGMLSKLYQVEVFNYWADFLCKEVLIPLLSSSNTQTQSLMNEFPNLRSFLEKLLTLLSSKRSSFMNIVSSMITAHTGIRKKRVKTSGNS